MFHIIFYSAVSLLLCLWLIGSRIHKRSHLAQNLKNWVLILRNLNIFSHYIPFQTTLQSEKYLCRQEGIHDFWGELYHEDLCLLMTDTELLVYVLPEPVTDPRSAFPCSGGESQALARLKHYFWDTVSKTSLSLISWYIYNLLWPMGFNGVFCLVGCSCNIQGDA